ncbi:MAG: HAMP domain-containing sensor histidine kinase [bacterium]
MAQTIEELIQENTELKKQNSIKSDLISVTAHQLRTSLSAMKWILKMFIDGDFGDMTTEQKNFMQKALDSDNRMISFVNEMLSMNHSEDSLDEMKLSTFDVIKLIDEVIFDFTGESYKKGIQLVFLKPEQPTLEITADYEKIRVVIQNLVENAIKYSNKETRIVINASKKDSAIEISVHDNGIGITTEEQQNIFGKFFRATNAKQQDVVGSGLGLYTTKRIVEKHKGKIWFDSKINEGTTFFVQIPTE